MKILRSKSVLCNCFHEVGAPTLRGGGGVNTRFCQISPKNCKKFTEFGSTDGDMRPSHPLPRSGKPGKRHFPVRGGSGNFETDYKSQEKIIQNAGKIREFHTNIIYYVLVIFE